MTTISFCLWPCYYKNMSEALWLCDVCTFNERNNRTPLILSRWGPAEREVHSLIRTAVGRKKTARREEQSRQVTRQEEQGEMQLKRRRRRSGWSTRTGRNILWLLLCSSCCPALPVSQRPHWLAGKQLHRAPLGERAVGGISSRGHFNRFSDGQRRMCVREGGVKGGLIGHLESGVGWQCVCLSRWTYQQPAFDRPSRLCC